MKDKALEELFLANKMRFTDNDAFMDSLTKRLDAVEYIRQHQQAAIRRYKMAVVAAFMVGVVSAAVTVAYVLSLPTDSPVFTFTEQTDLLLWLTRNSHVIVATALSLLMTVGVISIASNIHDIHRMRVRSDLLME